VSPCTCKQLTQPRARLWPHTCPGRPACMPARHTRSASSASGAGHARPASAVRAPAGTHPRRSPHAHSSINFYKFLEGNAMPARYLQRALNMSFRTKCVQAEGCKCKSARPQTEPGATLKSGASSVSPGPGRPGGRRTGVVQQDERLVELREVRLVEGRHRHGRQLVQDRAPAAAGRARGSALGASSTYRLHSPLQYETRPTLNGDNPFLLEINVDIQKKGERPPKKKPKPETKTPLPTPLMPACPGARTRRRGCRP
jgi:hypothetical protein